jgi:hypothetical protein
VGEVPPVTQSPPDPPPGAIAVDIAEREQDRKMGAESESTPAGLPESHRSRWPRHHTFAVVDTLAGIEAQAQADDDQAHEVRAPGTHPSISDALVKVHTPVEQADVIEVVAEARGKGFVPSGGQILPARAVHAPHLRLQRRGDRAGPPRPGRRLSPRGRRVWQICHRLAATSVTGLSGYAGSGRRSRWTG